MDYQATPLDSAVDVSPSRHEGVSIDTDRTLEVSGGTGVGAYVESFSGGHWRLSWTCDTTYTREVCPTEVSVRSRYGELREVRFAVESTTDGWVADDTLWVQSDTRYGIDAVEFDADYDDTLEIRFQVAGAEASSYLFFVNGGTSYRAPSAYQEVAVRASGY